MTSYEEFLSEKMTNYATFCHQAFPCQYTEDMLKYIPKFDFLALLKYVYGDIRVRCNDDVDKWVAYKLSTFGYPDAPPEHVSKLKAYGELFVKFLDSSPD